MRQIKNLVEPQEIGRKRYITDEDEAFRQGFFGEDYKDNENLQQRVNSAIRDSRMRRTGDILRTSLEPENNIATKYTENASERPLRKRYDIPEPGRYGWLSSEEGQKALDGVSLALSAGSLIPGADTFTDLASIPVDLLRGDYMSAAFDAVGLIPFVGEVGDSAKLARIGANVIDTAGDASRAVKAGAELIENADDAIDFAKYTDDIIETAKSADNIAEDIYSARKVDGTIQGYLDSVEDPIKEMGKMSKSITQTSPIKIPNDATIKPKKTKTGYYHMEYNWTDADGYYYKARWHTKTPNAPLEQRDVWVIERGIKGIGYGKSQRNGFSEILVAPNMWVDREIWEDALDGRKYGNITKELEEILEHGHWKA